MNPVRILSFFRLKLIDTDLETSLKEGADVLLTPLSSCLEERPCIRAEDHHGGPAVYTLGPPEFKLVVIDNSMADIVADHGLPQHVQVLLVLELR